MDNRIGKAQATVVDNGPKRVASLTAGEITPPILLAWGQEVKRYLKAKAVPADEQVEAVAIGLKDPAVANWYNTNETSLKALSLDDFLAAVRRRWFKRGWDDDLRSELEHSNMTDDMTFDNWCENLQYLNNLLIGTDHHLDDASLRKHVVWHCCTKLRLEALSSEGKAKSSLMDLKDFLSLKDADRRHDIAIIRSTARRAVGTSAPRPTADPRTASAQSKAFPSNPSGNTAQKNMPKLSDDERAYLNKNHGCYKCRQINVTHDSRNCPNGFPDPKTYISPLASSSTANTRSASTRTKVGAIYEDAEELETVNVGAITPVAPVAPIRGATTLPSAVLSRGDEDLSSCSDESGCVPRTFTTPHILWHAVVHARSTLSDPMPMLIDTGSPAVLVDSKVVAELGLKRRPLPAPKQFGTAWGSNEQTATEWVKLKVSSPDFAWTSRTCTAIVVNNLFQPVILGLPFYRINDCNIDPSTGTFIDRSTGRDLLMPSPPSPAPDTRSPRERRRDRQEDDYLRRQFAVLQFRDVLSELKLLFSSSCKHQGPVPSKGALSFTVSPAARSIDPVAAVRERIEALALTERLQREDLALRASFADVFPDKLPPITDLPADIFHRFRLKDANKVIARRSYDCPKKYYDVWKRLLDEHMAAGRLRHSSSPYASPAFLIPKSDPTADPRWVNDYRALNDNTIPDVYPLPLISDILADCAKGKYWAKIDMTNSFFQTHVHPDDIPFTAVSTPFGLYEWTVMPQGCRNAPATHQRRMHQALLPYIGTICRVYLDDIVIWSQSIEEHRRNVQTILEALRRHRLYCNPKKTQLFCTELDFLGHHISQRGVEASNEKVEKIMSWPAPRNAREVRSFLGLVRYISSFLPALASHTRILNELTKKEADAHFAWTQRHFEAFEAIKRLVTSHECLTTIDHLNMKANKIFVSCDASDYCTGAVLSYGETLQTARPVAFESQQLKGAELNYRVHEKEMLAIIRALTKWRSDLIGVHFEVLTDHRTLENFDTQKHLSRRQARWQEFMSQYDYTITYVKGEDNSPADAMSRRPDIVVVSPEFCGAIWVATRSLATKHDAPPTPLRACATRLDIATDAEWLRMLAAGYKGDKWACKLIDSMWDKATRDASPDGTVDGLTALANGWLDGRSVAGVAVKDGLLLVGERLVVPRVADVREKLFQLAHDALGHFGTDKSYAALRSGFYWPHMRHDLANLYIPQCEQCQRNKGSNVKPTGPLHPLPVPDARCNDVALDFVGPLPADGGYNCILTMTCRLNSDFRAIPTRTDISAEDLADVFFREWYCNNGLPCTIVCDRDKLFVSRFWRALCKLTGVKLKMSSSFHPETDGASERSNKTLVQALRYHVERNQQGWARALPLVRFNYMNTVNESTGFSPFQLRHGRSPRLIPPVFKRFASTDEEIIARTVIDRVDADVMEAQDNLLLAKSQQMFEANKHRGDEIRYKVGDRVLLSTMHRRREYMQKGDNRVAKFMVRYDGPYTVAQAWPDTSVYTLDLPEHLNIFPTFHSSLLRPFRANDDDMFPSRAHPKPPPVVTERGQEEYFVERILDRRRRGRGWQYLVRWCGYGPEEDRWLPGKEVDDLAALDKYLEQINETS